MKRFLWITLLLSLLVGCQGGADNESTDTAPVVPSATVEAVVLATAPIVATQTAVPTLPPSTTPQPTMTNAPTATPTITPTPTNTPIPVNPVTSITLVPVTNYTFVRPTSLTHAGDERLFVTEQQGVIRIIENGQVLSEPFLYIVSRVGSTEYEQGLLSVAFHPNYAENGYFFVDYTDVNGRTVISRFQVSADNPNLADHNSEQILLTIPQPYANHNGGQLQFGPDGYLYVGMGDGGSANDPLNSGQTLDTLLGKLLRLDVDFNPEGYAIPATNPFVANDNARNEIWAYGLRNPWRFSFDRL
ncbi:MAG: PQQ-dependent sugar dehydrogenase, partial [Anaerolineales bacterium]|nr:PQQ-dependent sugar dehydrogenase [Anaerolineales bacterium]